LVIFDYTIYIHIHTHAYYSSSSSSSNTAVACVNRNSTFFDSLLILSAVLSNCVLYDSNVVFKRCSVAHVAFLSLLRLFKVLGSNTDVLATAAVEHDTVGLRGGGGVGSLITKPAASSRFLMSSKLILQDLIM
jgi:hypothetical protein